MKPAFLIIFLCLCAGCQTTPAVPLTPQQQVEQDRQTRIDQQSAPLKKPLPVLMVVGILGGVICLVLFLTGEFPKGEIGAIAGFILSGVSVIAYMYIGFVYEHETAFGIGISAAIFGFVAYKLWQRKKLAAEKVTTIKAIAEDSAGSLQPNVNFPPVVQKVLREIVPDSAIAQPVPA